MSGETTGQPNFDEFGNKDFANWKRIRLALEHENFLTNARITWLLSTQAFLLSAYIYIFSVTLKEGFNADKLVLVQLVLYVICLVGALLCVYISAGIKAAFNQHSYLVGWWKGCIQGSDDHPDICGREPTIFLQINYSNMPVMFFILWIGLAIAVDQVKIYAFINQHASDIIVWVRLAVVVFLLVFAGFVLGKSYNRDKRNAQQNEG